MTNVSTEEESSENLSIARLN